jgi:DNA-binding XRE family transcriptional regulator
MNGNEFSQIRQSLGKTQVGLARLLCVSPRAVQSFEQGWRKIPADVERQLLFVLASKRPSFPKSFPCWETQGCSSEWRESCAAWEYKAGNLCWFINGTLCHGKPQETWEKKIALCRRCKVFQSMFPDVRDHQGDSRLDDSGAIHRE